MTLATWILRWELFQRASDATRFQCRFVMGWTQNVRWLDKNDARVGKTPSAHKLDPLNPPARVAAELCAEICFGFPHFHLLWYMKPSLGKLSSRFNAKRSFKAQMLRLFVIHPLHDVTKTKTSHKLQLRFFRFDGRAHRALGQAKKHVDDQ